MKQNINESNIIKFRTNNRSVDSGNGGRSKCSLGIPRPYVWGTFDVASREYGWEAMRVGLN